MCLSRTILAWAVPVVVILAWDAYQVPRLASPPTHYLDQYVSRRSAGPAYGTSYSGCVGQAVRILEQRPQPQLIRPISPRNCPLGFISIIIEVHVR